MSMVEPFLPHPERDETVAAADPGPGAPDTAPGFGIGGEDPDTSPVMPDDAEEAGTAGGTTETEPPFRTPDPDEVRRAP